MDRQESACIAPAISAAGAQTASLTFLDATTSRSKSVVSASSRPKLRPPWPGNPRSPRSLSSPVRTSLG
ncbi:MAG: hypothetical protein ACK559_05405, partial [bacterium]